MIITKEHACDRIRQAIIVVIFQLPNSVLCFFRGIYHITHDFNQLCKKLVVAIALIVTGECGTGTLADKNGKTTEHIPLNILS